MVEYLSMFITIIIFLITFSFGIYKYRKTLPILKFRYSNSNYYLPIDKNKKILFEKMIYNIEVLVTNLGNKEISIIDIFSPAEQTYQIKVFKDNSKKAYHILNKLDERGKLSLQKDHIPLINCSRLRIELSFILKTKNEEQRKETDELWDKLQKGNFIILTSNNKEYKINAMEALNKHYNNRPIGIFSINLKRIMISTTIESRTRHPNLGVRFVRKVGDDISKDKNIRTTKSR